MRALGMHGAKALVACLLLLVLVGCVSAHTIKHVIVLMEENRSFDHMLGWRKGVDGLKPTDCNWVDPRYHEKGQFCVTQNASNIGKCDPNHDFWATTEKIYGFKEFWNKNLTTPSMEGFVNFEAHHYNTLEKNRYCEVMEMFSVDHLPVMNGLADHFLTMDKFFCSMPGPTWPNRLFMVAGTSGGLTETSNPWFRNTTGRLYPMRTIYDQVKDAGKTWKNYVNDTPWELMVETVAHNPEHVVLMDEFYEDARTGNLPNFAFINPRAGVNFTHGYGSNDHHPDHDVALGERYYKDIYEALRASPAWNDTLFILTYDEHGGFYDHVAPEVNIPPPDNYTSWPDKFNFDRSGIRIPTLLISPWIPKGKVEGKPPAASKPQANSHYELTSIMATVRKILNISEGPLTKRDAWAATFEHLLNETSPRTDCPQHLPRSMEPQHDYFRKEARLDLNSLQTYMAKLHGHLSGKPLPDHVNRQGQISQWLQDRFAEHKTNIGDWKSSKVGGPNHNYTVRCEPYIGMTPKFISGNWTIPETAGLEFRTVYVHIGAEYPGQTWCLDAGNNSLPGTNVTLSRCYDTDPLRNRDKAQQWVVTPDATLRPFNHQELCVTNNCVLGSAWPGDLSTHITLEKCNGALNQRYAYMGASPGNTGWYNGGMLAQGDAIWSLVVTETHNDFQ